MRTRFVLFMIAAIIVAGVVLAYRTVNTKVEADVDVVAVNALLKTVESHYPDIQKADFGETKTPFIVIDNEANMLFESSPSLFVDLNDAIKKRSTVVDVHSNGALVGKLIVPNEYKPIIEREQRKLATVIVGAFSLLAVLSAVYAFLLHVTVFRPFKKLKSFATNIARGNLDIPLKVSAGNPFGAFTESFDIMREELAAARESEYAANRSKKELVASLSHDVKTPIASIKAISELMLLRADDEKTIKQLNMIVAKAEQINLLVTDMFHATLEEIQQLKVEPTEELSSFVEEMIASVNYYGRIHCEPIPPCAIVADVSRLQQVFDNVLSNAYKYAGTDITIQARIQGGFLEIDINDYGKGVAADEMPLLTGKFYRGTNAEGFSGTGLGLHISYTFMQRMQGELECWNRNDGFTVTLRLKLI
ncbi:HAMP domain-containing sensor histidine kinase [Gorillibacterium massiliense]|uniref:HAMP domain-containing sensor histidine kinase n=1 Tax=Gorillibacterium massiliense TaxID=1280390 RepID=UPI0004B79BCD|nr:HAMP domain-containing sensor histidine kinase [Gorillibacterium massiliense]